VEFPPIPEIDGDRAAESAFIFQIIDAVTPADLRPGHIRTPAADQLGRIVLRALQGLMRQQLQYAIIAVNSGSHLLASTLAAEIRLAAFVAQNINVSIDRECLRIVEKFTERKKITHKTNFPHRFYLFSDLIAGELISPSYSSRKRDFAATSSNNAFNGLINSCSAGCSI
jgi:hypothetical protein